ESEPATQQQAQGDHSKKRQAEEYINRITNARRQDYARAYMRYLLGEGPEPHNGTAAWPDISPKVSFAVRGGLNDILLVDAKAGKPQVQESTHKPGDRVEWTLQDGGTHSGTV